MLIFLLYLFVSRRRNRTQFVVWYKYNIYDLQNRKRTWSNPVDNEIIDTALKSQAKFIADKLKQLLTESQILWRVLRCERALRPQFQSFVVSFRFRRKNNRFIRLTNVGYLWIFGRKYTKNFWNSDKRRSFNEVLAMFKHKKLHPSTKKRYYAKRKHLQKFENKTIQHKRTYEMLIKIVRQLPKVAKQFT